jgi:hypothetical protein
MLNILEQEYKVHPHKIHKIYKIAVKVNILLELNKLLDVIEFANKPRGVT